MSLGCQSRAPISLQKWKSVSWPGRHSKQDTVQKMTECPAHGRGDSEQRRRDTHREEKTVEPPGCSWGGSCDVYINAALIDLSLLLPPDEGRILRVGSRCSSLINHGTQK